MTSPRRHGHALPGHIPFDQPPHAGTHSDRARFQGFSLHFLPSSTPERVDLQPLKPDSASPAHRLTISSLTRTPLSATNSLISPSSSKPETLSSTNSRESPIRTRQRHEQTPPRLPAPHHQIRSWPTAPAQHPHHPDAPEPAKAKTADIS